LISCVSYLLFHPLFFRCFLTHPAPPSIYTLSLHDALPIFTSILAVMPPLPLLPLQTPLRKPNKPPRPIPHLPPHPPHHAHHLPPDRKSTRLNSSHVKISYAVFCLKKKKKKKQKPNRDTHKK